MEAKESGENNSHEASQRLGKEKQELRVKLKIVAKRSFDGHRRRSHDKPCADDRVEQKQKKVLVIVETNTIVNPWAVVIHTQNAAAAHTAMMTTIRLILPAPFAMTSIATLFSFLSCGSAALVDSILLAVLPVCHVRNSTRVGVNAMEIRG